MVYLGEWSYQLRNAVFAFQSENYVRREGVSKVSKLSICGLAGDYRTPQGARESPDPCSTSTRTPT